MEEEKKPNRYLEALTGISGGVTGGILGHKVGYNLQNHFEKTRVMHELGSAPKQGVGILGRNKRIPQDVVDNIFAQSDKRIARMRKGGLVGGAVAGAAAAAALSHKLQTREEG